ncbi:phospholipase D family protein [Pseudomonas syringae]|uniref:phospholipase D family protein n=1 Tax=Pseudomonas syringae TaxID=317 RepID=UPI001E58767F|nr:phospholipase D family protein [Pseudomonas syringae]
MRTDGEDSRFRAHLNRLIRAREGDTLVLCSGYIYHSVEMAEEICQAIRAGCMPTGKVIIIAGKLGPIEKRDWENQYRSFAAYLKNDLKNSGIGLEVKQAPDRNWHAKLAFKLIKNKPIICLLGSSNLTGAAYSSPAKFWNYESDILLWDDNHFCKAPVIASADDSQFELEMVIRPGSTRTEATEMQKLYNSMINLDLTDITDSL